jgi:hypothetical protein
LGVELPSDEEMEAVEKYFEVEKGLLQSDKTDEENNENNKKKSKIFKILGGLACVFVFGFFALLVISVLSNSYGLTSKSAAGGFADQPCIHTDDYDIYYTLMGEGDEAFICVYRPVKKIFLGYKTYTEDYKYRDLYMENGEFVGVLYSFEESGNYNNIYVSYKNIDPVNVRFFDKITANGKEYDVEFNSYFVTDEKPQSLVIGGTKIIIDDVEKNI